MKFAIYETLERPPNWAWRLIATNGKIVAIGGESYRNLSDLLRITGRIFGGSPQRLAELEKAAAIIQARRQK